MTHIWFPILPIHYTHNSNKDICVINIWNLISQHVAKFELQKNQRRDQIKLKVICNNKVKSKENDFI
jgi:hypothetical protein